MPSRAISTADVESRTVVWIDSRRALLVRWDGGPHVVRLGSEGPPPRRRGPRAAREIVGQGPVHERLADLVAEQDARHGRSREVTARPAKVLTEAQLIARVREIAGDPAPRGRRS